MKSKKILKIVLFIILVLLIVGVIYFSRNLIILNKLAKAKEEMYSSNNYSYSMKGITSHGNLEQNYLYKDGKMIIKTNYESESGEKLEVKNWYNIDSNESISLSSNDMEAYLDTIDKLPSESFDSSSSSILSDTLKNTFKFFIKNKEIDGKKYYAISLTDSTTFYFNKETGLLEIIENADMNMTIKFNNFKINDLTDEDVERPDLSEYTVIIEN